MEEKVVFSGQSNDLPDKKHILVVDDNPETLKALRYSLQDEYKVSLVNSGKVAVDFLLQYKPDLILLDYMMPMYTGADVLKAIKDRDETKDIPVFILTSQTDIDTIRECMALNPAGYILKPIAKDALLSKLDSFFKNGIQGTK